MTAVDRLDRDIAALDRLEVGIPGRLSTWRKVWMSTWPKVAAIAIGIAAWQVIVWSGWKPTTLLPGPFTVLHTMWNDHHVLLSGVGTTLRRAVEYYALSLSIGTLVAIAITRVRSVRTAVTPLVTGFQSMPSVAWVPMAIVLFGTRPEAILFVTLVGSIPAVIIGTVSAIDAVPPVLLRAGEVLGAGGINRYRHVVLPAALPGYVSGVRQGWAFAWRSLMAGELIVAAHGANSLGQLLSGYQDQLYYADMFGVMLAILAVGVLMDSLVFSRVERTVLERRGLAV